MLFSVEELLTGRLETVWRDTSVPGDVHTELMRYGVILDPAVGTNDVQTLWVERQVWVYKPVFLSEERSCLPLRWSFCSRDWILTRTSM